MADLGRSGGLLREVRWLACEDQVVGGQVASLGRSGRTGGQ